MTLAEALAALQAQHMLQNNQANIKHNQNTALDVATDTCSYLSLPAN